MADGKSLTAHARFVLHASSILRTLPLTSCTVIVFTLTVGQSFRIGDLVVAAKAIEGEAVIFEFDNSDSDRIQGSELYGVLWTPWKRPEPGLTSNAGYSASLGRITTAAFNIRSNSSQV
jgi:hypothetical protein